MNFLTLETATGLRLGIFSGVFFAIAVWEALTPRRPLSTGRRACWTRNLTVAALKSAGTWCTTSTWILTSHPRSASARWRFCCRWGSRWPWSPPSGRGLLTRSSSDPAQRDFTVQPRQCPHQDAGRSPAEAGACHPRQDGFEVDLIISANGKLFPVKIRLPATPTLRHADPRRKFAAMTGRKRRLVCWSATLRRRRRFPAGTTRCRGRSSLHGWMGGSAVRLGEAFRSGIPMATGSPSRRMVRSSSSCRPLVGGT